MPGLAAGLGAVCQTLRWKNGMCIFAALYADHDSVNLC